MNVASECGLTATNYKQLNELYEKYSETKGLRILAFPCNQFNNQEPGDGEAICTFVSKNSVKFDMFAKVNNTTLKNEFLLINFNTYMIYHI